MDSRTDESCNLKRNLEFTVHDVISTKEQTVINTIKRCISRIKYANTIHCFKL